jgi:cytochrome c biogenesis protein CcmG/thiol:disulfide interchange protein DsbE
MIRNTGIALLVIVAVFAGCRRETASSPAGAEQAQPSASSSPALPATPPESIAVGGSGEFPAVGSSFPGFKATRTDGKVVELASLKGKVVLVNVWATWCGPCQEETPALQDLYGKDQKRGLEIAGISVDSAGSEKAVGDFISIHRMTYPIYLDPDGRSTTLLHTSVLPTSVLLDRDGIVRWVHVGAIRAADPDFDAALEKSLGS